jgi:DNA-binding MarR family transcriptional regulator
MKEATGLHELFMELVRVVSAWHFEYSVSQALALHALDADPPLSQQELAARLRLEKSSVSRLVADLERRGLIQRHRDEENRRVVRLRLTDAGRQAHIELGATFHQHYTRWTAELTPAERDALVVGLSALLRASRHGPAEGRHGPDSPHSPSDSPHSPSDSPHSPPASRHSPPESRHSPPESRHLSTETRPAS